MRGLKWVDNLREQHQQCIASLTDARIEIWSHPSRMRGLKLLRISRLLNLQWIASLTDARIEIRLSSALVRSCVRIASLTDARIEINNKQGKPTNSLNRIPHGCADWNKELRKVRTVGAHRIPHGCADWNILLESNSKSYIISHPSRMRGLK